MKSVEAGSLKCIEMPYMSAPKNAGTGWNPFFWFQGFLFPRNVIATMKSPQRQSGCWIMVPYEYMSPQRGLRAASAIRDTIVSPDTTPRFQLVLPGLSICPVPESWKETQMFFKSTGPNRFEVALCTAN